MQKSLYRITGSSRCPFGVKMAFNLNVSGVHRRSRDGIHISSVTMASFAYNQLHAMPIMTKLPPSNAKLWFVDYQRLENGAMSKALIIGCPGKREKGKI